MPKVHMEVLLYKKEGQQYEQVGRIRNTSILMRHISHPASVYQPDADVSVLRRDVAKYNVLNRWMKFQVLHSYSNPPLWNLVGVSTYL